MWNPSSHSPRRFTSLRHSVFKYFRLPSLPSLFSHTCCSFCLKLIFQGPIELSHALGPCLHALGQLLFHLRCCRGLCVCITALVHCTVLDQLCHSTENPRRWKLLNFVAFKLYILLHTLSFLINLHKINSLFKLMPIVC